MVHDGKEAASQREQARLLHAIFVQFAAARPVFVKP